MNCKKCNNALPEGTQVCPFCGEVQTSADNMFEDSLNKIEQDFINQESSLTNPAPAEDTPVQVMPDTTSVDGVNLSGIDVFTEPNVGSVNIEQPQAPVTPVTSDIASVTAEAAPVQSVEMAGNIFKNDTVTSVPKPISTPQENPAPVNNNDQNLQATQTTLAEVIARTQAHQVVDPNAANGIKDENPTISFKRPDVGKEDSKIFVFIVLLLVLCAAGLFVYMVMKCKNNSDDNKNNDAEQTEVIDNSNKKQNNEIEAKSKDANDVVIDDEVKEDENRRHVTTSETSTQEETTIPDTNIPSTNTEYTGDGEDKSNDSSFFNYFNYGGIKFKIPGYLDVILDSSNEYYITDNTTYIARFSLLQGGIKYIESNLNSFISAIYTPLNITPSNVEIFATQDGTSSRIIVIYYEYDGKQKADFIVNINDEISAFYEVPVYIDAALDFMLYDFDFISKNNQILGTFSKSSKAKTFENVVKGNLKTPIVR